MDRNQSKVKPKPAGRRPQPKAPKATNASSKRSFSDAFNRLEKEENLKHQKLNAPEQPQSKHTRKIPPQSLDPLSKAARDIVYRWRMRTFEGYRGNMKVYAATGATPIIYSNGSSDIKEYIFSEPGRPDLRRSLRLSTTTVHICVKGIWITLDQWLDRMPPVKRKTLTGQQGYDMMNKWWKLTGKTFPILGKDGFAAEVREILYKHALGPDITTSAPYSDTERLRLGFECERKHFGLLDTEASVEKNNFALLRTNRQVYREAKRVLEVETTKVFMTHEHFNRLVDPISGITVSPKFLRYIELKMDHKDFFSFFGARLPGIRSTMFRSNSGNIAATYLRELLDLRHLVLTFRSPKFGPLLDPWNESGQHLKIYRGKRATSCQKIVVDWIIGFAHQYIKKVARIELAGCIKNSTKQKWEKVFEDERRGIAHNVHTDAILGLPHYEYPPNCHCTTPCAFEGVYDELSKWENHRPAAETATICKKIMDQYTFDPED